MHKREHER